MNECPLSIWVDSGKRLLFVLKTETSIYVGERCFITKNQYSKDLFFPVTQPSLAKHP